MPTPLYTNRPVEPLEAKAAPLNLMCILALPLENGFGLGAHASSVLINSIGVPQLYANVPGYREYEHAGSVRSQATT